MGHRAQKNVLAHGYRAETTHEAGYFSSRSERPAFTNKRATDNKGRGYDNVPLPYRQAPKRDKWEPRHIQEKRG